MSDIPESRPGDTPHRAISRPAVIAAVFLGLHILPLFWPSGPLWGVDFLFFMSRPIQGIFILLAVLLFFPGLRLQIRSWKNAFPFALWGQGRHVWITRILILLVAPAAFVSLSSARHFLGDGYLLINELTSKSGQEPFRAPLSFALISELHQAGQALWRSAENTYRIYSYTSGVFYLLIAFAVAAAIGKNPLEKSIVLVFLITPGYMQVFFGYVENYPLYFPALLLYLLLGLKTEDNCMPLCIPAIVLGLLLGLHRAFGVFVPSFLVLAYRQSWGKNNVDPIWKNAVTTMAAICCVPLTVWLVLGFSGVGIEEYLSSRREREFLPLFEKAGIHAQYRMFSLPHLLDFINLQLLTTPVAGGAIIFFTFKLLRRQLFLLVSTAVSLVFTLLANPGIGTFRDWDIFSLPAVPLTLWTVVALLTRIHERDKLFHGAFLLCGAAVLHTISWVGINANAGATEARFVRLADGLRGEAGVYAWVGVGNITRKEGRIADALNAYKRALDANPADPNRWLLVGAAYIEMGRSEAAIEYYEKARELRPDLPVPYMNLGSTYSDLGQFDNAIEYTRKAIALQPDFATAHSNLGAIYIKTGQFEKAVAHLERASELQPQEPSIYSNLGLAYSNAGQHANAILALRKALVLRPDDAVAYGNLGVVYSDIGQFDEAVEFLKKALDLQPDYVRAYANLGYVYRNLRQYRLAIEHFEKALELHAGGGELKTLLCLGDTYYIMEEYEQAIPYYQRAIQLAPDHTNANLLLGLSYRALKRGDEARAHFEKTLELEPDHPQAGQIRQWLRRTGEGR